jgi:excisionase family DNA binding protein
MNLSAETERWLSVEEIAYHIGVSKETIYRWAEKRKMPAHKVGRQWKFKTAEVDSWILAGNASEDKLNSEGKNEI